MLSSFSPYVSPGLMPQFTGLQGFGGGAFGNPYAQMNPYPQGQFTPHELLQSQQSPGSYTHNPLLAHNPLVNSGGLAGYAGGYIATAQQIVPLLAQLAQQISIQGIVTQQLGVALQQLAQQAAAVTLQSQQTLGAGAQGAGAQGFAATPFGGIGQSSGAGAAFSAQNPFTAQNPFAGVAQGAYGGFNPQAQAWWGGNRSQTIQ
jgi:hypothetical protein